MPDFQRAMSRVAVGDMMPEATLPGLDGKPQALRDLYGKRLTVVVLWRAGVVYDLQELRDMASEVQGPYGSQGVRVIAVNERNTSEEVRAALKETSSDFSVLLDRDGALFAKVGTDWMPRTLVLDPAGKILWFDILYQPGTLNDLMQLLRTEFNQPPTTRMPPVPKFADKPEKPPLPSGEG